MILRRRSTLPKPVVLICILLWCLVAFLITSEPQTTKLAIRSINSEKQTNSMIGSNMADYIDVEAKPLNAANFQLYRTFSYIKNIAVRPQTVNWFKRIVDNEDLDLDPSEVDYALGEFGKPVILPKNLSHTAQEAVSEGWKKNAFNQYISDMISIKRKVPDPRDAWCKKPGRFLKYLPQTSVVICFHNEAWSTLLRTVHSVIDRSPPHLIREIILVDDFSNMPHLMQQLDDYMSAIPKVRIIRAKRREGLVRARLIGATYITAPVLTYLDSHCECAEGWLEPLLDRIARNKTAVVFPVVDVINDDTLEFQYVFSSGMSVGGFDWSLQFNWHPVPVRERARHKHLAEPVRSPTMPGGLFSINKDYFEKLGTYDSGFEIWGGENLELSFKIWMCGGTLEVIPCSHVGHIFRKRSPYEFRKGEWSSALRRNSARLAEVWLDDYAKFYYQHVGMDKVDYGDVSSRKALRQKLGCKSFDWYLKNIYPELFIPDESAYQGEIRNMGFPNICLDSMDTNHNQPVGLYACHGKGGNQYWVYSKSNEIRRGDICLGGFGDKAFLLSCHGENGKHKWLYDINTKLLKHYSSQKCLAISKIEFEVKLTTCNVEDRRQMWMMDKFNTSAVKKPMIFI